MLVGGIALGVGAVHLLMGWHSEGPVVFGDEGGYLRIARHLAGDGPVAGTKYFPGYSLLIVPIHWALGSTGAIFNGVKTVNAFLGATTVVLAFLTTGYLLPRHERWRRLGATALVSLYPSYLLFSNHAFSENALVPLSLLLAYLVARLVPGRAGGGAVAGVGALAASTVVVHPRSVGMVAALGVVVAVWWWPWSANWRRIAALTVGFVVVVVGGFLLLQLERSGAPSGDGSYQLGGIIERRTSFEGLRAIGVGAAGQLLYLVVSTGGMVVLGAVDVVRRLRGAGAGGDRSPRTALVVYAGLASLTVFATSAVSISPHAGFPRPDAVLYGRYNEGALAPLLLVGASVLVSGRYRLWDHERWWRSVLVWVVGLIIATAAIVELWQIEALLGQATDNPFNILTLYPLVIFFGGVDPLAIAGVGVFGAVVFLGVSRRSPALGVALASLAFLAIAVRVAVFHLPAAHYDLRARERVVAQTVNAIDERFGVGCVGLDQTERPVYHFQLYRWYVDDARLTEFSSAIGEAPCGPLVATSRTDLDAVYSGARLVTREGGMIESYLWVLPGELQEQLEAEGIHS